MVKTDYFQFNQHENVYLSPTKTIAIIPNDESARLLAGTIQIEFTPDQLAQFGRDLIKIAGTLKKFDPDAEFNTFWKLYPNKRGSKKKTRELWNKINDFFTYEEIRKNIEDRLRFTEWGEYAGTEKERFIPHSTKYLNQEMWTAEIKPLKTMRNKHIMESDQEFDSKGLIEKPLDFDL